MTLTATKAISVRQPWAYVITQGYKPVENRSWSTRIRGPVLIHAGLREERDDVDYVIRLVAHQIGIDRHTVERDYRRHRHLSAIVGAVTITDCVTAMDGDWFHGRYGFVMANAITCQPVACKGALSFWLFLGFRVVESADLPTR